MLLGVAAKCCHRDQKRNYNVYTATLLLFVILSSELDKGMWSTSSFGRFIARERVSGVLIH
jgi:hypothetical protein